MRQNTSTAVMARRVEPPDSADYFPTPPWATRALVAHVIGPDLVAGKSCLEPACGEGHMARPLGEFFASVAASDGYDYGGNRVADFLSGGFDPVDWVITNPPFRLAERFVLRGLGLARVGVAMLCRGSFLESERRHRALFAPHPLAVYAPFVERVPMFKGRLDPAGSTATAYAWFVWRQGGDPFLSRLVQIPPCRKALERPGDYGEAAPAWAPAAGLFDKG
ncbi:MAG: SAM-dependent DNA methyltransferase [Rhodospirillaceae bacterium]